MKMTISKPAAKWYIEEMDLQEGDCVRFLVRYGGFGGIHKGFSLAISNDNPKDPVATAEALGITFFVEKSDSWYFDGFDFHIKYSRKYDEAAYVIE